MNMETKEPVANEKKAQISIPVFVSPAKELEHLDAIAWTVKQQLLEIQAKKKIVEDYLEYIKITQTPPPTEYGKVLVEVGYITEDDRIKVEEYRIKKEHDLKKREDKSPVPTPAQIDELIKQSNNLSEEDKRRREKNKKIFESNDVSPRGA